MCEQTLDTESRCNVFPHIFLQVILKEHLGLFFAHSPYSVDTRGGESIVLYSYLFAELRYSNDSCFHLCIGLKITFIGFSLPQVELFIGRTQNRLI